LANGGAIYNVEDLDNGGDQDFNDLVFSIGVDASPTLTATPAFQAVNLSWDDTASDEDGYVIERKSSSQGWAPVHETLANVTAWVDRNVTVGTAYTYRVRSFKGSGASRTYGDYSNEASATPRGGAASWYFNNFEGNPSQWPEWSSAIQSVTPLQSRKFLGEYANEAVSLTWPLPTHNAVTVEFDLYVLRTWDGIAPYGGEVWSARTYEPTQTFEPGRQVIVMDIAGATAIVWAEI